MNQILLTKTSLLLILASVIPGTSLANNSNSVSVLDANDRRSVWTLGAGLRAQTSPYEGQEIIDDFMPIITYSGEGLYIAGTEVGYHLIWTNNWKLDLLATYRFGGYDDDDSDFLVNMEREDSLDAGFRLTRNTWLGDFGLEVVADTLGRHNGKELELNWSETFRQGRWQYGPWLGAIWQSDNLSDYYFGVRADEALPEREFYKLNDTLNVEVGIDMNYQLDKHHQIIFNVSYVKLDDDIVDSPIVDEEDLFKVFIGYRYEFDDELTVGNDFELGTEKATQPWFFRVAAGLATDDSLHNIIQGSLSKDDDRTRITSVFGGQKISDRFWGLPLQVFWMGGIARHFERNIQRDFWEYVFALKVYYVDLPWSDRLQTRIGFAEGISYVERIPVVELESVLNKNRSASHVLNYLDVSIDINMGDLFNSPDMSHCYTGFSVHHRSGIFGSADIFGNVDGGSNYNTLYVECQF